MPCHGGPACARSSRLQQLAGLGVNKGQPRPRQPGLGELLSGAAGCRGADAGRLRERRQPYLSLYKASGAWRGRGPPARAPPPRRRRLWFAARHPPFSRLVKNGLWRGWMPMKPSAAEPHRPGAFQPPSTRFCRVCAMPSAGMGSPFWGNAGRQGVSAQQILVLGMRENHPTSVPGRARAVGVNPLSPGGC